MTNVRTLTVSALNAFAKGVLEQRVPPVWVTGEIFEWKTQPNGISYFTLTDKRSSIRCVMFARDGERLPMIPMKGMQVKAFGFVTMYEARGEYQLQVSALESQGEGGLRKAYIEKTRKKLETEGLLPKPIRKPIPRFPMTVGVVTSPVGAAIEDIRRVVARRAPWTQLVLAPARVQGEGAAKEIVKGIVALYRRNVDVIIVARGGGSSEDLWAFEDEHVARAIARCPIPIVTGIGHATDVTTADLVADLRETTPTAAAEKVVQDRAALDREFEVMRSRLANAMQRRVKQARNNLDAVERDLLYEVRNAIKTRGSRLAHLSAQLNALSPLASMSRGFSVALDENGKVLKRVDQFGDAFELRVTDGKVNARVESKEKTA